MTTLLRYDLATGPFPLQASPASGHLNIATLTIVAANPNADPEKNTVTVKGISVTLPIGPDAKDLTNETASIGRAFPKGLDAEPNEGGRRLDRIRLYAAVGAGRHRQAAQSNTKLHRAEGRCDDRQPCRQFGDAEDDQARHCSRHSSGLRQP